MFTVTAPDLVACWCDVHSPALHSASCCLGGCVSVLWDSQPRGWCRLRGHQRGLTLLTHIPVSTGMAMAQSPRAGHILRYTVICGHVYGPMQRVSVWQLETTREGNKRQSVKPTDGSVAQVSLQKEKQQDTHVYYTAIIAKNKHSIHVIFLTVRLLSAFRNKTKHKNNAQANV